MNVKEIIAKNIAGLRKQKGMTQAELADKLCYSNKSISKWERADSLPDAETLYNIAKFFDVDINYLFEEHEFNKLDEEENKILERKDFRFKLIFVIITTLVLITLSGILVGSVLNYLESVLDYSNVINAQTIIGIVLLCGAAISFLTEGILLVLKFYKYVKILTSIVLWCVLIGLQLIVPPFPLLIVVAIGIVVQTVIVIFPRIDRFYSSIAKEDKKTVDKKDETK